MQNSATHNHKNCVGGPTLKILTRLLAGCADIQAVIGFESDIATEHQVLDTPQHYLDWTSLSLLYRYLEYVCLIFTVTLVDILNEYIFKTIQ